MTCPDRAPGGTSQAHSALHGIDNRGVDGGRMSFEHAHGAVPVRFPTSSRATSYRAAADEVDAQHTTSPASSASHSNMSGSSYFDGEHSRGDKGKSVARPVTIPSAEHSQHSQVEDVFAMSPVEASSALYEAGDAQSQELYPSSSPWQAGPCELQDAPDLPSPTTPDDAHEPSTSYSGKGKRRAVESPATLGLAFTPLEVKYGRLAWPSSVSPPVVGSSTGAGPSSYSPDTPPRTPEFETPTTPGAGFAPTATEAVAIPTAGPSVSRPERVRTMSNDSTSSTRSIASKIRVTLRRRGSSYLTKKLRFGPSYDKKAVKSGNILQGLPAPDGPLPTPPIPDAGVISSPPLVFDLEIGPAFPIQQPLVPPPRPGPDVVLLKGRSYSSPYPLTSSVLDIIPPSTAELTLPITFELPCHFQDRLPHELKVRVFAALVRLHEEEHERVLESGSWTALKAASTRHRWVGTNKGVRELVKLGRVSKSWMAYTLDGQLWAKLDLRAFPHLPTTTLLRIAEASGSFTRILNLAGHSPLQSRTLNGMTDHMGAELLLPDGLSVTQLTELNLRGCSGVTTRALHHLLLRSPALIRLVLRGSNAVTNTTCDIIAGYCPRIEVLDVTRCYNLDGAGLLALCAATRERGDTLRLKELRAAGLHFVTADLMSSLARAAPLLEVLDLSGCRGLTNSALRAFVECSDEDAVSGDIDAVLLTSREAGRDPTDPTKYWRRVTRLRHLTLSSCTLLTDVGCKHLAHAVPALEILELAGVGSQLHDEGLVHLIITTPLLRKFDLEDASNITDSLILALTPARSSSRQSTPSGPPQLGERLEHLVISYAHHVTDDALLGLIQRCKALRVLEADNTRMSGRVMQEFVRTARRRATADAVIVAGDNRNVGESSVREVVALTRPRLGWRGWDARPLGFLDARDREGLEDVGNDECAPERVVVKTFYSWQMVDAVRAARKKRAKARRLPSWDVEDARDGAQERSTRSRWWVPSRRSSAMNTPTALDAREGGDACMIM